MRTETFETPGRVELDIRLGAGEIRVETAEVTETKVVLEPLRGNDATTEAIQEARVESRDAGDAHHVLVDLSKSGRRFGRGPEVRVLVTAPHGSDLRCRSASADVVGSGRFGEADIEVASGDVQVGDLSGDAKVSTASGDQHFATIGGEARLNTASGDVQIQSVGRDARVNSASGDVLIREVGGELHVNSASGDVLVREVGGGASINTASGDVQLGAVQEGSFSLKSASGDLKVGIREGSRLYVDARSRSGEVTSELDVSGDEPGGEGPLVELRANTMSGDIQIVRA